MNTTDCIFCGSSEQDLILSLGYQPLANSYLNEKQLNAEEPFFPLALYLCPNCLLAHIEVVATGEDIFSDYAYFSSYSTTWLEHAKNYAEMITQRLDLNAESFVVEIASNDGYLLQNFVKAGVPCLGIEPAANVAKAAEEKGVESLVAFFGVDTAGEIAAKQGQADLILGNNVLAHTPMPNDLIAGMKRLLKPDGSITMEFPHLYRLIGENQFDTIYHEHFSYFSFIVVEAMFKKHGLTLFDVEELPTHGGSLRIYAKHDEDPRPIEPAVDALRAKEIEAGMLDPAHYHAFAQKVELVKKDLLAFLASAKAEGKRVVGYGAPAKGNTLLNYCGVGPDSIAYTLDRNPHKQGLYLPGSHIPICDPEKIKEDKPDYLLILPWNLKDEIIQQMAHIRDWGGRFVVPIPTVEILA